jgi:hypothetical protein
VSMDGLAPVATLATPQIGSGFESFRMTSTDRKSERIFIAGIPERAS